MPTFKNLPVQNPHPDGKYFIDFVMGRTKGGRVPLVEYLVDETILRPVTTQMLGRPWAAEPWPIQSPADRELQQAALDNFIQFWYHMGYDFVRFERGMGFSGRSLAAADTAANAQKDRNWSDEHHGMIANWDDFERYPWPKIENVDFFPYEYLSTHLPEGMGLMVNHAGGMLEHLTSLLSYEGLAFAVHDQPDLVQAIADRVGGLMVQFYQHLLTLDNLIAVFPGDDMGFHSATLLAPQHLRQYVLPWHKRFAALAHAKGLPYFIHSCGNLTRIMDDLIDDVRIDAKHSYEDSIIPVEDFQAKYGGRVSVLGGVDIHRLSTHTPEQIRQRVRFLIETCGGRGRYAIGSGNSIPSYIPLENYLSMVDEALN